MPSSTDGLVKDGRKHVVIVGAGAAGMSCAATLANHPDKFRVTILERMDYCGGQATSIPIDKEKFGADWLNDGVQGGSPAFKHTRKFFQAQGYDWQSVRLQVAFGKGADSFWTNVFPSELVNHYKADIKKFGKVLNIIKYTMPVLGLVPMKYMLRLFMFNKDFGDKMVIPLIALFLGTGNQTANVACAVLERLFHDPNMKLWDYDSETLLPNLPEMVTFPHLSEFYKDWKSDLESKGVEIRLKTDVTAILSRNSKDGVRLQTKAFDWKLNNKAGEFAPQVINDPRGDWTQKEPTTEHYDELVMCTLADDALKLLRPTSTWRERFVLGGAHFFDDITITHNDTEYFDSVYETRFNPDLAAKPSNKEQEEQLKFAKGEIDKNSDGEPAGYNPIYYTHVYKEDPQKIEMAFDATNYQHQFRGVDDKDPNRQDPGKHGIPYEKHVFQSIFLDRANSHLWTLDQIDKDKVIDTKWWHQLGHRWQHYVRVVPGMMFLQGKNKTWFAGNWTLVNMHELACVSGIAAAYRLGATYEEFDEFGTEFFKKYLWLSHGTTYKKAKSKAS